MSVLQSLKYTYLNAKLFKKFQQIFFSNTGNVARILIFINCFWHFSCWRVQCYSIQAITS